MLRVGASSAIVRILLRHRDKLILIERRLNGDRGGRIVIFGITGNTLKVESSSSYSSEDLTEKILEIFSLREDPRKSRSTYIFSNVMYVPQFNIHQTLVLDDKQRRELVDRVLGLDKYMTALNSIEKIAKGKNSVIGSELYNINKMIEDRRKTLEKINVNEVRTKLSELRARYDKLNEKLIELRKQRESLETEKEKLDSIMYELSLKIGELRNKIRVIDAREKELKNKKEGLSKILSEIGLRSVEGVNDLVRELQTRRLDLEDEYSRVSENLKQLDEKLRSIEGEEKKTLSRVSRLEARIESIKSRVREIWSEVVETRDVVAQGICPLCRQSITREYGEKLVRDIYAEMRKTAMEIVPLIRELWAEKLLQHKLSSEKEEITKIRSELSEYQNKILEKLREVEASIPKLNQVAELHEEISKLEREVLEKARVAEELNSAEEELRRLNEKVNELKSKLSDITKEEVNRSKELGEVSKQIENLEKDLERYSELSDELRKLELRVSTLTKVRDYLINHIYKGVETIESTVRNLAHDRFSEYFQEYFIKLLEDQELVEASVSDFKPVLKVSGEVARGHEISQPSGAQLIALGLAYRLALNRVVRDLNKELRDSVLIMDEPTLGFSPERVEKLRELIESIRSNSGDAQVILVTHDERLLAVGDCKIRLSINQSRNETIVDYEECFVNEGNIDFREYVNFVSSMLLK